MSTSTNSTTSRSDTAAPQNTNTRPTTTSMGACRSCGAYGGSQHRPTCQPGRVFKLGRSRRAARDRYLSSLVLRQAEYQPFLIRNL